MRTRYLVVGTLALLLIGACGVPDVAGPVRSAAVVAAPVPAAVSEVATVAEVDDGDTFTLTDGRTVRVLGVDSCEGDTGPGRAATADATALIDGATVTLRPEPGVDRDRYGRALRYVAVPDGRDLATIMVARPHTGVYLGGDAAPSYVAALQAVDDGPRRCADATTAPQPSAARAPQRTAAPKPATSTAAPTPKPAPQKAGGSGCHPSYVPCVPAGPDLDCPDIGHPVQVVGTDSFRLDADDDGVGCE